jgi:hypothetical protein
LKPHNNGKSLPLLTQAQKKILRAVSHAAVRPIAGAGNGRFRATGFDIKEFTTIN